MIIVNSGDPERYVLRCSQAKRLQTPPSLSGCIYFDLLLVPCVMVTQRPTGLASTIFLLVCKQLEYAIVVWPDRISFRFLNVF